MGRGAPETGRTSGQLKAIFTGDHAWCGEKLLLTSDLPDAVSLPVFFEAERFGAMLDRFAGTKGAGDRRAAASFWSLYYFSALAIPFIVARRAGWALPMHFDEMVISVDAEGLPRAFGIASEGDWCDAEDDLPEMLLPLVDVHLSTAVLLLKERGGIAPKLAWNNAAVYIDYALNATATGEGLAGETWSARALFERPAFADGQKNPFFGCLRHEEIDGQVHCRRKVCCLRYMLPGIPGCGELCALPDRRQS